MIDEQHELLIQKCVDGELDVETQQHLLAQLDVATEGWKVLALAYVEDQTWHSSFSENNRVAQQLESEVFARSMGQMVAAEAQEVQCFMPPTNGDADGRSRLLTQVTCLAIALVGGVLVGDIWRSRSNANGLENNIADNSKSDTPKSLGGNQNSDGSFVVSFPGRDGEPIRMPAYPMDRLEEYSNATPSPQLQEIEDELRRQGLRFEEDELWITLELQDGRRALMPVNRWKVRPGGQ